MVATPLSAQRVIGVDLGGTKILAGSIDVEGQVLDRHEVPTPTSSQEELLEAIAAAIEPLAGGGVGAIGLGIPSVLDRSTGRALGSINIPLTDFSLHDLLGERFGIPVAVENDANVAALAEWKLGAGRGAENLVLLTLGTGVGGGVIMEGALYRGWAELGHVVVVADGPPCQGTCTGRGHLEAVASGNAADRAAEKLWGEGATAELLVGRAEEGDPAALEALAGHRPSARRRDRLVHQRLRAGAARSSAAASGSRRPSSCSPRPTRSPGERRSSPRAQGSGSSRPSSAPTRG